VAFGARIQGSVNVNGSGGPVSTTLSAITNGNIVILCAATTGAAPVVSDNQGNSYSAGEVMNYATGAIFAIYYLLNCTNGPTTFSMSSAGAGITQLSAEEFTGTSTAVYDTGNQANDASSGEFFTPGNITPSSSGELLIAYAQSNNYPISLAVDSPFTIGEASVTLPHIASAYYLDSGSSAITSTFDGGSANNGGISGIIAISAGGSAATASLAVTMPDLTLVGTATVPIAATLAKTMPAFTLSGTATVPVGATLAVTMPNFTLAGTGTIITAATLAKTIADLTLAGTATVSGGVVSGTLAATMPAFTLVGTAGVISAGSLAATIPSFTLVGTAQVLSVVTAALAATFPAFILTATALVGKAPVPPPPDGVSNFIMQGLLLGTIVTDEPIAAGAYKVSVSARWNQGSKITIGTINGPAYSWTNNSRRGVAFPLGQLVVTVQNATSVKIVISPS
jgi:hypothetical protein